MKKYKLTNETIKVGKKTLYRIKALRSFGLVTEGELGGFIGKESNLSHDGNCWVTDDAQVFNDAKVIENAKVSLNAKVFGNAEVSGSSRVSYNAEVYGYAKTSTHSVIGGFAKVYGNAFIFDHSWVYGNAKVCGYSRLYGNSLAAGNVEIFGNAVISGNAKVMFGICTGKAITIDNLCQFDFTAYNSYIKIGCKEHTVSEWQELLKDDDLYLNKCRDKESQRQLRFYLTALISELKKSDKR